MINIVMRKLQKSIGSTKLGRRIFQKDVLAQHDHSNSQLSPAQMNFLWLLIAIIGQAVIVAGYPSLLLTAKQFMSTPDGDFTASFILGIASLGAIIAISVWAGGEKVSFPKKPIPLGIALFTLINLIITIALAKFA